MTHVPICVSMIEEVGMKYEKPIGARVRTHKIDQWTSVRKMLTHLFSCQRIYPKF